MSNITGTDLMGDGDGISLLDRINNVLDIFLYPALCVFFCVIWMIFLSFYHTRVWGIIISKIANRFVKEGYVHIGSISFSVLTGKLMFRDVAFITTDFSVRVQDGLLIFRWWRRFHPLKELQEISPSELATRLNVTLFGFEYHCYNRSSLYDNIQKAFGLEPTVIPESSSFTSCGSSGGGGGTPGNTGSGTLGGEKGSVAKDPSFEGISAAPNPGPTASSSTGTFPGGTAPPVNRSTSTGGTGTGTTGTASSSASQMSGHSRFSWRDFFSVIKVEIYSGRVVFGNHLTPSVLIISMEDAHAVYTTLATQTPYDCYTHEVKCDGEGLKVMFAPSPKYEGVVDEPPRYMGEGFAVLQTNTVYMHYYQDEAGIVPMGIDGNAEDLPPPYWALDVTCGKGTHLSYGPWADRQRDALQKFFFPQEYKTHDITLKPVPGDKREFASLNFRLNILAVATIDMLFTKNKETNAVHIDIGAGSYIEVCTPLLVGPDGYESKVTGQLLHVESSTSLEYRSFVESETLQFQVFVRYPRRWNHHQNWEITLTFSKATAYLIFGHKIFISDLFSDWSSKSRQELYSFVPYTMHINIILKEFELLLPANEYNWIDCSSHHQQNAFLAFVGEELDLSVVLPFSDYLPETVPVRVLLRADAVSGLLHLPESYTGRSCLEGLDRSAKASSKWKEDKQMLGLTKPPWQKVTGGDGWTEVAGAPYVAVSVTYTYHPLLLDEDVPTVLVKRTPTGTSHTFLGPKSTYGGWMKSSGLPVPSEMSPDTLNVEVDIGPAVIMAYGTVIKCVLALKENYLGINDKVTDFFDAPSSTPPDYQGENREYHLNAMSLRPMQVTASLNVEGLKAYLPMYCGDAEICCPMAMLEQLCFELNKGYKETTLQLLLSPVTILVSDAVERPSQESHLNSGHLGVSGLQLRCHAMFSDEGLPIDSVSLEYAWLIELQVGVLTGRLTLPQVLSLVNFAQLFIHLGLDSLDDLTKPCRSEDCVHMVPQPLCRTKEQCYPKVCPTEGDLKYRMVRVSVKMVELLLVESGCATRIEVDLIRIATCNLHTQLISEGVSVATEKVKVQQYVSHQPGKGSRSKINQISVSPWLECGSVCFGPLHLDSTIFLGSKIMHTAQAYFLKVHDRRSQRLWFLWPGAGPLREEHTDAKCGCLGGCLFFSSKSDNRQFLNLAEVLSGKATGLSSFRDTENDYGRSILQKGQWVFALCDRTPVESPSKEFKFTHAFASGLLSPTHAGEVQPAKPEEVVPRTEEQQQVPEPVQLESSSQSGQELIVSEIHHTESASTMVASMASEPSVIDRRGSSVTVGSVPVGGSVVASTSKGHSPWVGSCQSLPVEPMTNQWGSAGIMTHARNMSADAFKYPQQVEFNYASGISHNLDVGGGPSPETDFETPDSGQLPILRGPADSLSSGSIADSEYYSADDDFTPNTVIGPESRPYSPPESTTTLESPQSPQSPSSQLSHATIITGETLSSWSSQTVESPDKAPPSKPQMKSSSSPSYISAASSEETLAQMSMRRPSPFRPELQVPWCNTGPYRELVTQVTCEDWVTPSPMHPPFNAQDSPSAVLNKGNIQLPQFGILRQGLCPDMVNFDGGDTLIWETGSEDSEPLLSDDETEGRPKSWDEDVSFEQVDHGGSRLDMSSASKVSSETSCLVKIQGTLQVLLTPLLLEASTRFVDVVESVVSQQRPEAVIDVLHSKCVGDVETSHKNGTLPQGGGASEADYKKGGTRESTITVDVAIPKISVLFMQSGKNLTVSNSSKPIGRNPSILIACVSSLQLQFLVKSIKPLFPVPTGSMMGSNQRPKSSREQLDLPDPVDPNQEQSSVLASLQAKRVHCQLRSLPETTRKQEAHKLAVTAILEQHTRVMFSVQHGVDVKHLDVEEGGIPTEEVVSPGWILMECGLDETKSSFCHQTSGKQRYTKVPGTSPTVCSLKTPSQEKLPPTSSPPDITVTDYPKGKLRRSSQSVQQDAPDEADYWPSASASGKGSKTVLVPVLKRQGKTTDGKMTIKGVWIHLPAPKRSSEKDVPPDMCNINLLSAAVPLVDAWLESVDRLDSHMTRATDAMHHRLCAIMACILADAHDLTHTEIVPRVQSKYDRWAIVTKSVQQDLSCQLMSKLWQYLKRTDWRHIERLINIDNLPGLSDLEQGVHTLVRQWKVNLSLINPEMATAATYWRTDQPKQVPMATEVTRQLSQDEEQKWAAHMPEVELKITKKDRGTKLSGTGNSDEMDAVQQVYTSRYGTGYSMYDEFSGRPKPNVSRTGSVLDRPNSLERGVYLSPEGTEMTRMRSLTDESIGTIGTFRDGEKSTLDSVRSVKNTIKTSLHSLDALLDVPEVDGKSAAGYRRLKYGDGVEGSGKIGTSQVTNKPRASVVVATTSATQLGDADMLFRSLLKYLGITKKPLKPLKFAKRFGEVSVAFQLNQLRLNIAEISSKSNRKDRRGKRSDSSSRLSSAFPAFSCEDISFKMSAKETKGDGLEEKISPTEFKGSLAGGLESPKADPHAGMAIWVSARCGKIMQVIDMPFLRVASQLAGVAKLIQHKQSISIDYADANAELNQRDTIGSDSSLRHTREGGIQLGTMGGPPVDNSPARDATGPGSDHVDACSNSLTSTQDEEGLPKCWQTMYHLINLYSGVSVPVNIDTTRLLINPVFNVENELQGRTVMGQTSMESNASDAGSDEVDGDEYGSEFGDILKGDIQVSVLASVTLGELCILGQLAGIQVEAEVNQVTASASTKHSLTKTGKRFGKLFKQTTSAVSCEEVILVISEKGGQNPVPIITAKIEKPQMSSAEESRDILKKLSLTGGIGAIELSIPLSPAKLHSIVIHSSKKFATRMAQLQVWFNKQRPSDAASKNESQTTSNGPDLLSPPDPILPPTNMASQQSQELQLSAALKLKRICLQTTLLASLKVQYLIQEITACITPGEPVRFAVTMPHHSLKFSSQLNIGDLGSAPEITLPSIHFSGQYRVVQGTGDGGEKGSHTELHTVKLLETKAELEAFKHSVSTDLVNHLITVQKVLIQDLSQMVDELVETKEAASREFSLPTRDDGSTLIFSLHAQMKGIQITATTPSACAVRLETGLVDFELSNKPQTKSQGTNKQGMSKSKLFAKTNIDLNISLGTLVRNPMYAEFEPELHQLAYFRTRIALRNALKDEMSSSQGDKEAFLIQLTRPILYVQPMAIDKAVLVWLCYQSAYDQWFEQQATLLQQETRGMLPSRPTLPRQLSVGTSPKSSSIFLQLTLEELGICLPINPAFQQNVSTSSGVAPEPDYHSSLVLTLQSSQITACYSSALVSRGKFETFCLRFAEDFATSLDDWRPESYESLMNACVVPQGTYEVCSKTTSPERSDNGQMLAGKWLLNFLWRMEGFDVQVDPSIGHQLSALANTLTSLAGNDEDIADLNSVMDSNEESTIQPIPEETPARLKRPTSLHVTKMESKRQAKLMMQEMNEQAKVVSDLSHAPYESTRLLCYMNAMNEQASLIADLLTLGAKSVTIAEETERLRQLEALVFNDFRRDIRKKLRMQGMKTSLRDKLVGQKPTARVRRASTMLPADFRTPPKQSHHKKFMYGHDQDVPPEPSSPADWSRARSVTMADSPHPSHVTFNIPPGNTPSPIIDAPYFFGGTDPRSTPPSFRSGFQDLNASINDPTNISRGELETVQIRRRRLLLRSATISGATDSGSDNSEHEAEYINPHSRKKLWHSSTTDDTMSTHGSTSGLGRRLESSMDHTSASPAHVIKIDQTLDLELDIKFKIDSGKLLFHCQPNKQAQQMEQEPAFSSEKKKHDGRLSLEDVIFKRSKRTSGGSAGTSASGSGHKGRQPSETAPTHMQSVFYLPAVDVKTHYLSTSTTADGGNDNINRKSHDASAAANDSTAETQKTQKAKQAIVYTWAMFTTSSKEIVVAPALLDFLEQALESVPASVPVQSAESDDMDETNSNYDMEISANSLVSSSTMDYSTFPVDVVVYVCVQPSVICFSCLPTSKVECLLRLPSFELAFSSKGTTSHEHLSEGLTSSEVHKGIRRLRNISGSSASMPTDLPSSLGIVGVKDSEVIGLSISIVMSDFSLFVFHPYGGHQKRERLMEEVGSFTEDGESEGDWTLPSRKDALSLKVEFIKMTLSRSRKMITSTGGASSTDTGSGGGGSDDNAGQSTTSSSPSRTSQNLNQFSIVCDMGSASFKYDMRRLTELLAFPKAWYRKKIVRRLFLGEEGPSAPAEEQFSSAEMSSSSSSDTESEMPVHWTQSVSRKVQHQPQRRQNSQKGGFPYTPPSPSLFSVYSQHSLNPSPSTPSMPDLPHSTVGGKKAGSIASRGSQGTSSTSGIGKSLPDSMTARDNGPPKLIDLQPSLSTGTASSAKSPSWQTLVFVAVNFSKLEINMNMSNVMGTTVFSTDTLASQGYISIDSNRGRDFSLSTSLKEAILESKGGVIGGQVQLQDLKTTVHQSSQSLQEPQHELGVTLGAITSRIDYMGSSILMMHLTNLDTTCRDEWKIPATIGQALPFSVSRSTSVYINATLQWDTVQLMLCRTTTPDLIKVITRLEEFFSQQFQSSKQMLSSWQSVTPATKRALVTTATNPTMSRATSDSDSQSDFDDRNQYRHWQPVFEAVSSTQSHIPSPSISQDGGMTLGGHFVLRGKRALLACFHGINFRASSWALFTLREPEIQFETEALEIQPGPSDSAEMLVIQQDLLFSLGHNQTQRQEGSMGIIYRVTRNDRNHFPSASSVDECFQYACAIKAPEEFRQFLAGGMGVAGGRSRSSLSKHAAEPIFALPKLQLEMRSKHQQILNTEGAPQPVVTVSFVTHFTDHIHVSMDIELILFLHDLVTHYISYKEKALAPSRSGPRAPPKPIEPEKSAGEVNPSVGERDRREFQCTTWQLEPTVRLLSWGGKQIEPVGVDYILHKLGFKHARVTIPKWMQRGVMDPVDNTIAFIVQRLIRVLSDEQMK